MGPACGLHALKYISYPAQVLLHAQPGMDLLLPSIETVSSLPACREHHLQSHHHLLLTPSHCRRPAPLHRTLPQVLAKSSKMIPVMLMGTVLHGKRYSMLEYACCLAISGAHPSLLLLADAGAAASHRMRISRHQRVGSHAPGNTHPCEHVDTGWLPAASALILSLAACPPVRLPAAGVGLFGMKSSSKVTRKLASPNAPLGYTLCLVNLVLDGYTNAAQVGSSSNRAALQGARCWGCQPRQGCARARLAGGSRSPRVRCGCCVGGPVEP